MKDVEDCRELLQEVEAGGRSELVIFPHELGDDSRLLNCGASYAP